MPLNSFFNLYHIVKQIPIFSKLNWFALQKVARKSKIFEYKKGDIIRRAGDPPDAFYCLISGRLQAYTINPYGAKENIEFLHRGMHFGIISLFTGESHSLNFEAINDSVVLKIPKEDFLHILQELPQLGIEFSHSLSRRVRSHVTKEKSVFERTIISVYSPVKGTGSSTYAINLALNLQKETNKKVIFVDIHSNSMEKEKKVTNVHEASPQWKRRGIDLKEIIGDYEKIKASISTGELKIDFLNVYVGKEDTSLIREIGQFVSTLADDYHFVVVDLPNEMDDMVLKTLTQSDIVHLVTFDRKSDLKLTRQVIEQIKEVFRENFKVEKVQVIIRAFEEKIYLSYEEVNKVVGYDVYTMLPHISPQDLNVALVSEGLSMITGGQDSEYIKAIRRIARSIGGVLVGLALGGGAALGVAHIGVIKVLEEENIPIDIVVGSSMGALIGSLWTIGFNAKRLEGVAREFGSLTDVFKRLYFPVLPVSGLVKDIAIRRWLKSHLGTKTFYSTLIPLKIVAYDLIKREEIIINSGSLVDAVRKSISIPGVIKPVLEGGRMIIDGGVLNPLPTNVLGSFGVKKIIAVNVLQSPEHVSKGHEMEERKLREEESISFAQAPMRHCQIRAHRWLTKLLCPNIPDIIVRTLQATEYVIAEQSAKLADVVIHPDLTGINWFELYKVDELIESGKVAARKHLVEIKKLIVD